MSGRQFSTSLAECFSDRPAVLRESKRILKKRPGRITILDWRSDVEPEQGSPLSHHLSGQSAVAEMVSMGFAKVSHHNFGRYFWLVQAIIPLMGVQEV